MISADPSDAFWETMYGEAVRAGAEMEEPVYPEDFRAGLTEDYTAEELVRMAVAARVDGDGRDVRAGSTGGCAGGRKFRCGACAGK